MYPHHAFISLDNAKVDIIVLFLRSRIRVKFKKNQFFQAGSETENGFGYHTSNHDQDDEIPADEFVRSLSVDKVSALIGVREQIYLAFSVTRFVEISPLRQKFASLWQIFDS